MNSEKLADWLQVLGNFGLIAGLVLVAVQIQQNTEIAKAQIVSDDKAVQVALKLALIGENPAVTLAKVVESPDELTTKDFLILENLQMANFYHKSRNETLNNMGFATTTEQFSNPENNAIASVFEFLGTPYGIAWWELVNSSNRGPWKNGAPETGAEIEVLLSRLPYPEAIAAERINEIRKNLAALTIQRD